MVAAPGFVCRDAIKGDSFHRQITQNLTRIGFVRAVTNVDTNLFRTDEGFDHRA